MKINAIKDVLLLEYLEGKSLEQTTISGLIIKDNSKVKLAYKARVISKGPEVDEVEVGDKVIFKWFENEDIDVKGVPHTLVNKDKLLAIIT